ncbi:hypothetical protein P0M11_13020 [Kaistella sp. PBT33-4]|nr:hypothetical protein [Kaistella sp. PBT33-4]MDF0720921.1 hypothetical protein [Kaistella sp. PBT33-4]
MTKQWNEQYCHALSPLFVIPQESRRTFIGVEMHQHDNSASD